jgi:hypothetical protein
MCLLMPNISVRFIYVIVGIWIVHFFFTAVWYLTDKYTTIYLSILLLRYLCYLPFLSIIHKAAMSILVLSWGGHQHSFILAYICNGPFIYKSELKEDRDHVCLLHCFILRAYHKVGTQSIYWERIKEYW